MKFFSLPISILYWFFVTTVLFSQNETTLKYTVSIQQPATHSYDVVLQCSKLGSDTILLKMPQWMPGYYQLMNYAQSVKDIQVVDNKGKNISFEKSNENTWQVNGLKNKSFTVRYTITTSRQFVANSYVDTERAYILPANTFLYIEGLLHLPVTINLHFAKNWSTVATGLAPVNGKINEFFASDFDILYDSPILIGNLEELSSFKVDGVNHRFIGYKIGAFDHAVFLENLRKTVAASAAIIGDIPFKEYTFIGIGPGRGGIEHLNNTTISFDGSDLHKPDAMNRMMNFIAHEYFHHYNVKRIRPFELGPFDYDRPNVTNMLWISEGLTVYYEYLIVKRAKLTDENTFLANFEQNINKYENNPGKNFQSLQQASYSTWSDGPFGTQGKEPGKAISYYDKGPIVGLLLDFEIRHSTENRFSLDDVMRNLYWTYYKKLNRGFTEAEFQASCEKVAGKSLSGFFEYVYTTKKLDYDTYLAMAGLKIEKQTSETTMGIIEKFRLKKIENPNTLQKTILNSWMGDQP